MSSKHDSNHELVIHFKTDEWHGLCDGHFSEVDRQGKGKFAAGHVMHPMDCDIPWCNEKAEHEVYPMKKFKVSFWQPKKK